MGRTRLGGTGTHTHWVAGSVPCFHLGVVVIAPPWVNHTLPQAGQAIIGVIWVGGGWHQAGRECWGCTGVQPQQHAPVLSPLPALSPVPLSQPVGILGRRGQGLNKGWGRWGTRLG